MSDGAMVDRERFWSAVHEALDAGADPLEVPLVQEWAADNPADGDELARMLQRVQIVARARRTKPRRLVLIAAGVLLAGAAVTLLALRPTKPRPDELSAPQREPRSRILEYTLEVVREGVDSSSSVLAEHGHVGRSHTASIGETTIVCSLEGQMP